MPFIELAGEVNSAMPDWVVSKVVDGLNNHGKALKDSRVLVLGIAYKKNVDDMRESPSVHIMEILRHKGASVKCMILMCRYSPGCASTVLN